MKRSKKLFINIIICIILSIYGFFGLAAAALSLVPGKLKIVPGENESLDALLPINMEVASSQDEVLRIDGAYKLGEKLSLSAEEEGISKLSFRLLGVEIKNISVTVGEERYLVPGGQCIGVMLYTKGALVVGASDIRTESGDVNPAKKSGLLSGDIIEKLNGTEVKDAEHLSRLINTASGEIVLGIRRGEQELSIRIEPVSDPSDGIARLGVWVRDSTAGVGTLTYYDPESETFGGLGHAISDADTGKRLSVRNGEVIISKIIEIQKGSSGEPGELRGYFDPKEKLLGKVSANTANGLFADASVKIENPLYPNGLPVGAKEDLKTGSATLLCTIDDSGIGEYSCEITHIGGRNNSSNKNFTIKITDERLLSKTGGIVQGMSGSPIIQNGRLVGAVTHVLVSDPAKGYGIFIENMLEAAA